jgi:hypothetical protein
MVDLIPSTEGRPYGYLAEFLAGCAGLRDAISILSPEVLKDPEFLTGDEFFTKAVAWRDRAPVGTLEEYREEQREWWLDWIGQEMNLGGSVFSHTNIACTDELRSQSGHLRRFSP